MGRPLKINKVIEDNGQWLVVDVSTPRCPAALLKIDRVNWDWLVDNGFHVAASIHYKTVYAHVVIARRNVYLHRLILGLTAGEEADHINRDGLDNRRSNLRVCSRLQNAHNQGAQWATSS